MPAQKSKMSGTWAKTLLAIIKSCIPYFFFIRFALTIPKNDFSVLIPLLIATSATFFAGSMPKTLKPFSLKN